MQKQINILNSRSITNTQKVWASVKPCFSSKSKTTNTIIFHQKYRIIKDNKKISHSLNKYFMNLTNTLASPALKNKPLIYMLKQFENDQSKKFSSILIAKKNYFS